MAEESEVKSVTVEEFLKKDPAEITLVDLREPDEVLVKGVKGARNIPFSRISREIDGIPKEKPVYLLCGTGNISESVTEILTERGYDVFNIEGGK